MTMPKIGLPKNFQNIVDEYNSMEVERAIELCEKRLEDKFILEDENLYKLYFQMLTCYRMDKRAQIKFTGGKNGQTK
jgi:hypothetical protein